jgi:histidinol-phosphate aminotransferase
MDFDITTLLRENIRRLVPYSSARDEYKGPAGIFMDANENAFGSPLPIDYNRYPDPLQLKLKERIAEIKGVPAEHIFLGNGSDEVIDIMYRAFCTPGIDNVMICPPTYGMYEVSAHINDVPLKKVTLTADFQLDIEAMENAVDDHTKLIFICSPNNPTGNALRRPDIEMVLNNFKGIVVIDEAYINYARHASFIQELTEYPHLVVMQTLSKAWGLAALRIGMAFSSAMIIDVMNKIKPPYNINEASQQLAFQALGKVARVNEWIKETVQQREWLTAALSALAAVVQVYPSDANFLLVKTVDAHGLYQYLIDRGIVVRDRSNVTLCEGCLRITVGTPPENRELVGAMIDFSRTLTFTT